MRRLTPLLLLALVGCGGGSSRLGNNDDSDFDGRYEGTYIARDGGSPSGTLDLEVDNTDIIGTGTDSRFSGAGAVDRASFLRGGSLNLKVAYGTDTVTLVGRLTINSQGTLTGTVQEQRGATVIFYDVVLNSTLK